MKRKLSLILVLVMAMLSLFACGQGGGNESGGESGGEDEGSAPKEVVYSKENPPTLIFSDNIITTESKNLVYNAIKNALGIAPATGSDNLEASDHEIIFGESERTLSVKAYRKLATVARGEDDIGYVIMTDGKNIAVAYTEENYNLIIPKAVDYLINNVIMEKETLELKSGVCHSASYSLETELKAQDEAYKEAAWQKLADHLGEDNADIVEAMREHYAMYDSKAITWFASLYDPGVGSFYHSNSGRDTYGYLPDVESTAKILAFITQSGMLRDHSSYAEVLPESMKKEIGDFIYNLQDEDGYFYHPQWGKNIVLSRRGRDLSWSVDIMKKLGRTLKYTTITGVQGEDIYDEARLNHSTSVATAVSKVIAAAAVPDHLSSVEAFKEYLNGLNLRQNSYSAGNDLSSQSSQIKAQGLLPTLIEFLNENQFDHNGLWDEKSDYHAINGLMKISGIYNTAKVVMPNADKAVRAAIDAVLSDEMPGSVVSFYNPWAAICRIFENLRDDGGEEEEEIANQITEELYKLAPAAIRMTTVKVRRNQREDMAFSYYPDRSVHVSQKAPVCVPYTVESDVAGACISITGVTGYMYTALRISNYKVPIYGKADLKVFLDTINAISPIVKEKPEPKPLTFEDDIIGEKPSGFAAVSVKSNGGSATVVEKNGSNIVQVVSKAGLGDSIELDCNDVNKESKGFVFTGKFSVKSVTSTGTKAGAFLRLEFFGDKHVYRIVFNKTASGIEVHDASSNNTGSVAKTTHIATLAYDEWLDLKIEYTKGDKNTILFKIYVGGNLIAESHNYFDENADLETPNTDVKKVRFFNWINADCVWYMDDLYFYAVNE